jgi:hypothetical protein
VVAIVNGWRLRRERRMVCDVARSLPDLVSCASVRCWNSTNQLWLNTCNKLIVWIKTKWKQSELACPLNPKYRRSHYIQSWSFRTRGIYCTDDYGYRIFISHEFFMEIFFLQIFCVPNTMFPSRNCMRCIASCVSFSVSLILNVVFFSVT